MKTKHYCRIEPARCLQGGSTSNTYSDLNMPQGRWLEMACGIGLLEQDISFGLDLLYVHFARKMADLFTRLIFCAQDSIHLPFEIYGTCV